VGRTALPLQARLDGIRVAFPADFAREGFCFNLFPIVVARGCRSPIGADMLFERAPTSLAFFEPPSTMPKALCPLAGLDQA
jgi:hypothetical protein